MPLAPWRYPHASRPGDVRMSRVLAMPPCLSRPGDVRMPLAPWRCPHASRPGDVRMSRALVMPACLSRPGDIRMPRALAMVNLHALETHRLEVKVDLIGEPSARIEDFFLDKEVFCATHSSTAETLTSPERLNLTPDHRGRERISLIDLSCADLSTLGRRPSTRSNLDGVQAGVTTSQRSFDCGRIMRWIISVLVAGVR
ncbi:hypothetical protein VNO80_25778 [Phaseolus coccineus]|uniref:Uncharacterized protein n=1 Tax=Phaseolus coccineus TaxID=3886 RepID=A0AAN9LV93_PHACN